MTEADGRAVPYADLRARTPPGAAWDADSTDGLGSIGLLTAERVRAAAELVRVGEVFNLDLPLDAFDPPLTPTRHPPAHTITGPRGDALDDRLDGFFLQGSTQLDGLRHFRHPEHGYYGGTAADSIGTGTGDLGVQAWAEHGIVGRGVLLDLATSLGVDPSYDPLRAYPIQPAELESAAESQGVDFRAGDILLLHTGWLTAALADPERGDPLTGAGLVQSEQTVEWLWNHQFALIAADNPSVEVYPPVPGSPFRTADETTGATTAQTGMLHRVLIPLLGFALGELWDLRRLVAHSRRDGVWEMMVCSKPLMLVGGVGSPANAYAIK